MFHLWINHNKLMILYNPCPSLLPIIKIVGQRKKFLDYIAATLQGDVLQWLRQWKKSEIGKSQKTTLLANFLTLDTILAEFAKIIKENSCLILCISQKSENELFSNSRP